MRKIKNRERIESVSYTRDFDYQGEVGWGFGFPCDEHGNVDVDELNPCARENFAACLAGEANGRPVVDRGVKECRGSYVEPAIGLCDDCGAEVYLDGFTNTCDCGADYNMSGQRLAPRCQWGEETGESVADILSVDYDGDPGADLFDAALDSGLDPWDLQ